MLDSLILSLFVFAACLVALLAYDKISFDFLSRGKDLQLSPQKIVVICGVAVAVCAGLAWLVIRDGGPNLLQYFYIVLFSLGFYFTLILLLPRSRLIILSELLAVCLMVWLILVTGSTFLQNIILAGCLLWVGPLVLKKLKIKTRYVLAFLILFMIIDVYDIYFAQPAASVFSDAHFVLNGLIQSGNWVLGIGDFLVAYIAVNVIQKDISIKAAILAALMIAFFRFFFHVAFPNYAEALPYSLVITPTALVIYGWWVVGKHSQKNSSPNQYLTN